MSISARIDVTKTTRELEALLEADIAFLATPGLADDALIEWTESRIELIEDELAKREEAGPHADTPSLQDRGLSLGSYAS